MRLSDSKGYPWRASLTKKPRCATCEFLKGLRCKKENEVQYPTYSCTHDCLDFKFKPRPSHGLYPDVFNTCKYDECKDCSYNFKNRCSGKRWIPIKIVDGKCEFFRHKDLICKNAIPYSQYCNHLRNHYCKLPPRKRDQNSRQSDSWSWNCLNAHKKGIEYMKCYKPKKVV